MQQISCGYFTRSLRSGDAAFRDRLNLPGKRLKMRKNSDQPASCCPEPAKRGNAMAAGPLKRKLSAILAADAVSYSRKMSANEEGTMRVLSAHRAVIDSIIEFHDGRIVNTAGDSVLAEFGSPVEAVRCAVEIQDALRTRNDSLPAEQRLEFRVGVNLGDVMVKGDDLLGDGVNVAARLESIAEPGGICISSSIYDLIRGKLDLGFVDIGEQSLKNIEHPIRVYRVDRDGAASADAAGSVRKAPRSRLPAAAGVTVLFVAALGAAAWHLDLLPQMPWEAERQRQAAADAERRAKIEADLTRARAEAEAARSKAEAETAAAAEAKRALEEQRVAESKAAAAAELARARAEADAVKRRAETELAAAKQARERAEREAAERARLAAVAPPPAPPAAAPAPAPVSSAWSAALICDAWRNASAVNFPLYSSYGSGGFELTRGDPEKPGYVMLRGIPAQNGRLVLSGTGRTGKQSRRPGTPYEARFDGMLQSGTYEGRGKLGVRPCLIRLSSTR